jgi:hypothetical protein
MPMPKHASDGDTFINVKASDIIIDRNYQRNLDELRAKRMAENFNVDLFGVPVVSVRAGGIIAALDGQHRITARIMAGRKDDDVLVEAHYGLSIKQEAEFFLRLNGGRTAVHTWDKWRARLVAREPIAMDMSAIAAEHGIRFALSTNTKFCVSALNRAERVHKKFRTLNETLGFLVALGEGDPQWLSGDMIVALGSFLHKYGKSAARELIMVVLSKNAPGILTAKIRGQSLLMNLLFEDASKIVIADLYNAKAKGKNRLKK